MDNRTSRAAWKMDKCLDIIDKRKNTKLNLVYQWIKDNYINCAEFRFLVERIYK